MARDSGCEHKECPLCLSRDITDVYRVDNINIFRCGHCYSFHTYPLPDKEFLSGLYGEGYFQPYLKEDGYKRREFLKRIAWCGKYISSGAVLDVGCGIGTFISMISGEVKSAAGVELSPEACRTARDKYGLSLHNTVLEQAGFEKNTFDAITLWHVLEHISAPDAFLREINRILKASGKLIIEVPNSRSIEFRLSERLGRKNQYMIGEHLYHFSEEGLKTLLKRNGFEIIEISGAPGVLCFKSLRITAVTVLQHIGYMLSKLLNGNISCFIRVAAKKI